MQMNHNMEWNECIVWVLICYSAVTIVQQYGNSL